MSNRTTWFPFGNRVPETERAEFWDELIDRYFAEHPPDSAGRTHVAMVRLEVEAVTA